MLKTALRYGIILCLAVSLVSGATYARADDNKEYLVKAAFIYNFIKFVDWPDGKAIDKQASIDICVIGSSPMTGTGNVFKAASTARLNLSLVAEHNPRNAASHCHIVFISESEEDKLAAILEALKGHPVLTVSDIGGFAEHGGMIGFVTNDNKIKLEVNTRAISSVGLRIDPQLLEIALKVIEK